MSNKKTILLFLLSVGILAVIAIFSTVQQTSINNQNNTPATATESHAPKGKLISGFPQELQPQSIAADSTATIADSFSIPYKGFGQYSAVFDSNMTVANVYTEYLNYLTANGYQIINKEQAKTSAHIYAIKTGSDLNITITSVNGKAEINISYLNKPV